MRVRRVVVCHVLTTCYMALVAGAYVLVILLKVIPQAYFTQWTVAPLADIPLPLVYTSRDISPNYYTKYNKIRFIAEDKQESIVPVALYQFASLPPLSSSNSSFWYNKSFTIHPSLYDPSSPSDPSSPIVFYNNSQCINLPIFNYLSIYFSWNSSSPVQVNVSEDGNTTLFTSQTSTLDSGMITSADNGTISHAYQLCLTSLSDEIVVVDGSVHLLITAWFYNLTNYIQFCEGSCYMPASNDSLVYIIYRMLDVVPQSQEVWLLFEAFIPEHVSIPGLIAAPLSMFFACTTFCWCLVASKINGTPFVCCEKKRKKPKQYPYRVEMDVFHSEKIWPSKTWSPANHLSYPIAKQKQIMAFLIIAHRAEQRLHEPIVYKICNYIAQSDDYLSILHLEKAAEDIHRAREDTV